MTAHVSLWPATFMSPTNIVYGRLLQLQVLCRSLAAHAIFYQFENDLRALLQAVEAGTLNRADMYERIAAAVLQLNEAVAFSFIEPFYCAFSHKNILSMTFAPARIGWAACCYQAADFVNSPILESIRIKPSRACAGSILCCG